MSTTLLLLQPPTTPQAALTISQRAKAFFSASLTWTPPYPLSLVLSTESQAKWAAYENLFLACLRTGDNDSARTCLRELTNRFSASNEHIKVLHGLYREATAQDDKELIQILRHYDDIIKEDPTAFSVRKRRAALLRSMGRTTDAIAALTDLLDSSPTDAEAWSELGDLYLSQGLYEQAVYCVEEVLLVMPNAWNIHARLGEITYMAATVAKAETGPGERVKALAESVRRFSRSIELCDDYLRGYYGLKLATARLLEVRGGAAKKGQRASADSAGGDLAPPRAEMVQQLNELATAKLAEIVRRAAAEDKGWDGYSEPELKAARALLDADTQKIER